ncbi:MAG TPA: ABC transporter substrate-binding protein [Burkholderiales bacterium]|nr:ABC transporter substrate-binding protein [Burkholderiales bacterium]
MQRRTLLLAAIATSFAAFAQPNKMWRIGFLGTLSREAWAGPVDAIRAGLRERGYTEGKNLHIEYRWAEGRYERLPSLAQELLRSNIDLLMSHGSPGSRAAKQATTSVPVVLVAGNLTTMGIVSNLARPGGNLTGITFFGVEMVRKRLELLREAMPKAKRLGVVLNPGNPIQPAIREALEETARSLNVALTVIELRDASSVDSVFEPALADRFEGVVIDDDAMLRSASKAIGAAAKRRRLPLVGPSEFVDDDAVICYDVDLLDMYRRSAGLVDRIFKGAKPGELPVEQAAKFELIANPRAARQLGISLPSALLVRADRVID